ncbi:hypothetical protein N7492_006951 [Penicillium capsulatum]|uniref:Cytochrome P450 n=1 Tax=Penicillium capsulatum TaxID=69766 RepID=A0A9W9I0C4_9EURO|nr:hypothetical protein N7492_006951 [Penicillium capsulatum]KAJ6116784.1 hypothetical protein N7512_006509 [Penicillium capsulatum]
MHILFLGVASLGLVLLVQSIFRLCFHPLSKYPGPRLAAFTNWYATYFVGRGVFHIKTREWHRQYGPIVRYAPNALSFDSPTAQADIYGTRANTKKSEQYAVFSASRHAPNTITATEKDVYTFKRRTHTQFYLESSLKDVEDRILDKIDTFVNTLGSDSGRGNQEDGNSKVWSQSRNMADVCAWLTADVITDLAYGQSSQMLTSSEMRWILSVMTLMSWRGMLCVIQPKIYRWKLDRVFLAPAYKRILSAGTWAYKCTKNRVVAEKQVHQKDFFGAMINVKGSKDGQIFTTKDMWVETLLLMAAGSDTTSTAMAATFFYLAHCPDALVAATSEVRGSFAQKDDIRLGSTLNDCVFLQACINEAMRLTPSTPNILPRDVLAGGSVIDGEHIPAGMTVGSSLYANHRHESFEHPDEFWPERWIVSPERGVTDDDVKRTQRAFHPFSTGPRSCVGWKLAWSELNIAIARTLYSYDIKMADRSCCGLTQPRSCAYPMKGYAVAAAQGPALQFIRAPHGGV